MIKNKSKIAQAKVMSDFLTGLSIAWFSGGIIAPFISESFTFDNFILGLYSLFITFALLYYAILFKKGINNGN